MSVHTGIVYEIEASSGDLLSIADRNGNKLALTEHGIQTLSGQGVRIERDELGRITRIIDPVNRSIQYGYDLATGNLARVTNRAGQTTTFFYGGYPVPHYLTRIRDAAGVDVLSPHYNVDGQVDYVTDAAGKTSLVAYETLPDGQRVEIVAQGSGAAQIHTQTIRDARGNAVRTIQKLPDPSGNPALDRFLVTLSEYDDRDRQTRQSLPYTPPAGADPRSYRPAPVAWQTTSVFDDLGNLTSTTDALGATTHFTYDAFGSPTSITDPLGRETFNSYDAQTGNLTSTTDAAGAVTEFFYDDRGNLIRVQQTDPHGAAITTSQTTYNEQGLPTSVTDAAGQTRFLVYDPFGNQTASYYVWTDPANASRQETIVARTDYDADDRATRTREYRLDGSHGFGDAADLDAPALAPAIQSVVVTSQTAYDLDGRVATSTDRFGVVTTNVYNARSLLIETRTASKNAAGQNTLVVTRTVYDDIGRAVFESDAHEESDPVNNPQPAPGTQTIYDSLGRVVESRRLSKSFKIVLFSTGFSLDSRVADGVDPAALVLVKTVNTLDGAGRLATTRTTRIEAGVALGAATQYVYDAVGQQTQTIVDLDGNFATEADQQTTSSDYDAAGRLIHSRDALGHDAWYEYDAVGRQTAVVSAGVVDPVAGSPTFGRTVYPRSETLYDALGRRAALRENLWQTNPLEAATIVAAHVRETRYEYDAAGRLTAVVLPAALDARLGSPTHNQTVHARYEYQYDAFGARRALLDGIAQSDPLDANSIHRLAARETQFSFDAFGRETGRTLPLGVASGSLFRESTTYDSLGRVATSTDFEGNLTRFDYDLLGRLSGKRFYAPGNANESSPNARAAYTLDSLGRTVATLQDADGNLATTADQAATTTVYDEYGQTTRVVSPSGTVNYRYNELGLVSETFTGATLDPATSVSDVAYGYDSLGRLQSVRQVRRSGVALAAAEELTSYVYDAVGNLDYQQARLGAAVKLTTDYAYDALNRLIAQTAYGPEPSVGGNATFADNPHAADYLYTLGVDGQRLRAVESWNPAGALGQPAKTAAIDWLYDDLGRLIQERTDSSDHALDSLVDYGFDLVGNRVAKRTDRQADFAAPAFDEAIDYVYDANDRLLTEIVDDVVDSSDRHLAYEYGAASAGTQLTQRSVRQGQPAAGLLLEQATYAYNLQGRLRQALIDSNGDGAIDSASQYEYADDGVRTSRTVQGVTTLDLVDANNPTGFAQVLEERTGAAPTRSYTLGLDVIAQADSANAPRLLVYDGHGSTRLLVDPASTANFVVQAYAYDAYGQMLVGAGLTGASSAAATLLYSGEQTDRATGLQYLRARYYDPRSGRFATLDPYAGDPAAPQSLHKYLYVHANPVLGVDPSGHEFTVAGLSSASSIGSVLNGMTGEVGQTTLDSIERGAAAFESLQYQVYLLGGTAILGAAFSFLARSASTFTPLVENAVRGVRLEVPEIAVLATTLDDLVRAGSIQVFSKHNYRENLEKLLTLTKGALVGFDAHHVFPQALEQRLARLCPELNIHNPLLLTFWERGAHQANKFEYQAVWLEALEGRVRISLSEVLEEGRRIMARFDQNVHF